jgi:hypothetical protein
MSLEEKDNIRFTECSSKESASVPVQVDIPLSNQRPCPVCAYNTTLCSFSLVYTLFS